VEFILRFTFTNPDLDTTIVGTINPAHLQTNLDILQRGPLPPELYEEAKQRLAAAGSAPRHVAQKADTGATRIAVTLLGKVDPRACARGARDCHQLRP
jgi:aryl-alcohol dehydrogenase-like predicted oxidoreductase